MTVYIPNMTNLGLYEIQNIPQIEIMSCDLTSV
jgi:hypothetical protein